METKTKKITKIELQKKNENRVNIWLDNEFAFACSKELVYTHGLVAGKQLDLEVFNEVVEEDNYLKCKNSALKVIERTYKSEKELSKKLLDKGFEEKTIDRVMEFLKKYSFIDDAAYVRFYVKDKIKAEGKNKIKFSLIKKGISEVIINQELSQQDTEVQENTARALAEKKLKTLMKSETDSRKIYKKLADFLMRKGFQWEEIKTTLNQLLKVEEYD